MVKSQAGLPFDEKQVLESNKHSMSTYKKLLKN